MVKSNFGKKMRGSAFALSLLGTLSVQGMEENKKEVPLEHIVYMKNQIIKSYGPLSTETVKAEKEKTNKKLSQYIKSFSLKNLEHLINILENDDFRALLIFVHQFHKDYPLVLDAFVEVQGKDALITGRESVTSEEHTFRDKIIPQAFHHLFRARSYKAIPYSITLPDQLGNPCLLKRLEFWSGIEASALNVLLEYPLPHLTHIVFVGLHLAHKNLITPKSTLDILGEKARNAQWLKNITHLGVPELKYSNLNELEEFLSFFGKEKLIYLDISKTNVQSDHFEWISHNLKNLHTLKCGGIRLNKADFGHIGNMASLTSLDLKPGEPTTLSWNDFIQDLSKLNLTSLNVDSVLFEGKQGSGLMHTFPNLTELSMESNYFPTLLSSPSTNLKSLILFGNAPHLNLIPKYSSLEKLSVVLSNINDEKLNTIIDTLRYLKELNLRESNKLTPSALEKLAGIASLERLNLDGTKVTNKVVNKVLTLLNLRWLSLEDCSELEWETLTFPEWLVVKGKPRN